MSKSCEEDQIAVQQESELIDRAQNGDEAAMDILLKTHQDRVFRTALGLVGGDEEAALEIAQDVLISAFRHLHQFRGASKLSTWLYRMTVNFAKNRAVSRGRRSARFVSLSNPISSDSQERVQRDVPEDKPLPRDEAAGRETIEILRDRIAELPEEFRAALMLRYFEDLSYEEIAEALEVPIGTVKSRINRGRAELRKSMADILEEGGGS